MDKLYLIQHDTGNKFDFIRRIKAVYLGGDHVCLSTYQQPTCNKPNNIVSRSNDRGFFGKALFAEQFENIQVDW